MSERASPEPIQQRPTPSYKGLRLTRFAVDGLFGEFDYNIPIKIDEHVTAIIAPNGAGKTLCLQMVNALFAKKWNIFTDTRFSRIHYGFNEGTAVTIYQVIAESDDDKPVKRPGFKLAIHDADGSELVEWSYSAADLRRAATPLERYVPFITRVGPNEWRHDHNGALYNQQEILELYGHMLPDSIRERLYGKIPEPLAALISQIDCRLIETQRLLVLREEDYDTYYRPGRKPPSTLAIARKAQALKDIISRDISVYATLSQSLDRSFPRRVITRVWTH